MFYDTDLKGKNSNVTEGFDLFKMSYFCVHVEKYCKSIIENPLLRLSGHDMLGHVTSSVEINMVGCD